MAFFLLCVTIFVMIFQPTAIWPALMPYQPLRNTAILALAAYLLQKRPAHKRPFFAEKTNVYFVLFVIFQVASASILWLSGGIEMLNYWLKIGVVYYLIYKLVDTEDRFRIVVMTIVVALLYLWYYSFSTFVLDYYPGVRAGGFGWYENSNDLAIILVSVIPLIMYLINRTGSIVNRVLYLVLALAYGMLVLFTGSRNGMLALSAVGILSIMFSFSINKLFRLILFFVLVGGILTIGLTSILSRGDLAGAGLSGDASSENRIEQWYAAARMVRARPFFGIGPGEFSSEAETFGGIRGVQAHNTLIQVFAETGILGGLFFALFSLTPILLIKRVNPANSSAVRFTTIALSGFWICAFFSNRYQFYILYILVAMIMSAKCFCQDSMSQKAGAA